MHEEKLIWSAIVFGTILFAALGGVIVSFLFLYQNKKYNHKQEVSQMRENFNREMLHSKTEIQEQTLQHIATEIHDNFIPTLSVINLDLAGVLPDLPEPTKTVVTGSKALVKQLMTEMKGLSSTLNTDQISKKGFVNTLDEYLLRLEKTGYINISFAKDGIPFRLPANKEIILFRICQEALNNIIKHASAQHIDVRLVYGENIFCVHIKDNGIGFDVNAVLEASHKIDSTGLYNMRSRSSALNAELIIESNPDNGTCISIYLPTI